MNDMQLSEAVANKDAKAIELVMEMYSKLLWTIISSILKTAPLEEIEECVADVFFSFWHNPIAYDEKRGSLKTYLAIIAKNKAVDRLRQYSRSTIVPFDDSMNLGAEDVLSDVVHREMGEELMAAIHAFAEPDREIMIRRIYYEQKPAEISTALSLQLRLVQNKIYRSKKRLRNLFQHDK